MHIIGEERAGYEQEKNENADLIYKSKGENNGGNIENDNLNEDPINAAVVGLLRNKKPTGPITLDLHNNSLDDIICRNLLEEAMTGQFLVKSINLKLNKMNAEARPAEKGEMISAEEGAKADIIKRWNKSSLSVLSQVSPTEYHYIGLLV